MEENKKSKVKRWTVLTVFILLFLYGFESELSYFYYEKAKILDYILALVSSCLLLIYIIPLVFLLFWGAKKLEVDKNFIITSLVLGMFIPGFLAGIANVSGEALLDIFISKKFTESWGLAFTAPFNEEILKILVVLGTLFLWKKKSLNDFFLSGYAVGLGFQIMEDFSYIGSDGLPHMNNLVPLVLSRISQAWSSHWIYTSLFALGFYFIFNKKKISRGLFLIVFVLLNHFLWDSPYGEWEFVPAILGSIMILCLIYVGKKYIIGEYNKKEIL